jgi:hypothetical protein
MNHKIFFVILNWNLANDTIECVRSLLQAGVSEENIIIVDNGSTDDSVKQMKRALNKGVHFILHESNIGFAGGNNLGIKYALGLNADWVFLLNNDTFVDSSFLHEVNHTLKQQNNYDVIAPIIFYANNPDVIWSMGDRLLPGTLFTTHLLRNKKVPDKLPQFVEVDFVTGCGLLINRRVFDKIGYLDERFFMYGEDAEFCWRVKNRGFQIAIATNVKIWHKVAQSSTHQKQTFIWRIRNQIWFYRMAANKPQLILMIIGSGLRIAGMIFSNTLHGRKHLNATIISSWKEGWFGTMED